MQRHTSKSENSVGEKRWRGWQAATSRHRKQNSAWYALYISIRTKSVLPENVLPENVLPENVLPENVLPENVLPENVLPENVLPENVLPENAGWLVFPLAISAGY